MRWCRASGCSRGIHCAMCLIRSSQRRTRARGCSDSRRCSLGSSFRCSFPCLRSSFLRSSFPCLRISFDPLSLARRIRHRCWECYRDATPLLMDKPTKLRHGVSCMFASAYYLYMFSFILSCPSYAVLKFSCLMLALPTFLDASPAPTSVRMVCARQAAAPHSQRSPCYPQYF